MWSYIKSEAFQHDHEFSAVSSCTTTEIEESWKKLGVEFCQRSWEFKEEVILMWHLEANCVMRVAGGRGLETRWQRHMEKVVSAHCMFLQGWDIGGARNRGSGQRVQCLRIEMLGVKDDKGGTSLVVQWLRSWAPNVGGLNLIPGHGTRSFVPQWEDPTCHKEDPVQLNK